MARKTTSLPSRELVQLAEAYGVKDYIGGWLMSEKLDGIRMFWDGGLTRELPLSQVPFANVLKDARYVNEHHATGLWTRYGKPIYAPDWWLDHLPDFMLDGEVWLGRGLWEQTSSIVRTLPENRTDSNWTKLQYKVFDIPSLEAVYKVGEINGTHYKQVFTNDLCSALVDLFGRKGLRAVSGRAFDSQLRFLSMYLKCNETVSIHEQTKLSNVELKAQQEIKARFAEVAALGGEGLILRNHQSVWTPHRTKNLLKVKKCNDAEATVIGYTSAEFGETGAKLGLIGALVVEAFGKRFKLAGLSDEERSFGSPEGVRWAKANPGEDAPSWVTSKHFPRQLQVTFVYSELSQDGVPKEARYFRQHKV